MNGKTEKFSPHSVEAEEATIGSILIWPEVIAEVCTIVQAEDFFIVKNAWVFAAIRTLYERGDNIDTLTVSQELRQRGQLDDIGGPAYLLLLSNNTPTHIHVITYANMVARMAYRRRILATCSDMAQSALQEDVELEDVLSYCKGQFSRLLARGTKRAGHTSKQLASANLDEWERRQEQGGGIIGIPTGSNQLDAWIGGMMAGRVTFIGGRPKMGKTAAQLALLLRAARYLYANRLAGMCYMFSLEMSAEDVTYRLLAQLSDLWLSALMLGKMTDDAARAYTKAVSDFSNLPIFIDDTAGLSARDIGDRLEAYSLRYGAPALIVVDYVQIVHGGRSKSYTGDARHVEVEDAAYGLADLAKRFNCHLVSGAQVKQDVDTRQDKRPGASDLANSDGILRAASHVITLYRPGVYFPGGSSADLEWCLVANRHGETGTAVDMRWNNRSACMEPKAS